MGSKNLKITYQPKTHDACMVLGLSGWMDGGDVSTGTIGQLVQLTSAQLVGQIEPKGFYIYNFPGSMEISALFRPHTKIEDGIIRTLDFPGNFFWADEATNLVLLSGKEPNFAWEDFAECIFEAAGMFDVRRIYFVGSVAGAVPHTRLPRMSCSVSHESLKDELSSFGVRFSNYEGPASFITYLTTEAARRDVPMATLVAEIPAYVQGTNPICIEAVIRKLAGVLGLRVRLDPLRKMSDQFERKLNEVIEEKPDLKELISKLEADYDNEIFDTQMGDLKAWLQQKGIRLD